MRRIRAHSNEVGHVNQERWLLTYADMITLLTAFFLMLYSMSVMSRGKFANLAISVRSGFKSTSGVTSENGTSSGLLAYQQSIADLKHYMEQQSGGEKVNVTHEERGTVISLPTGMLFGRGEAALTAKSRPVITYLKRILQAEPDREVQVEGHTDNQPINTLQFPSNWELSTARAGAILRALTARGDASEPGRATSETAALPAKRFTCAGYADTRPVVPNDTEANRAKNRRVNIVLLNTPSPEEAVLKHRAEVKRIQKDSAE